MAHGEADHGCAQGGACRAGHQEQSTAAKHPRRPACGAAHPPEGSTGRGVEPVEEEHPVPRPRVGEPTGTDPEPGRGCLSDLPGWAGAHRHGPVRPRRRGGRRERPPQRWC